MTTQTPGPAPTASPRRRWLIGVGIGVAVIALAAVVYTVLSPAPTSTAAGRGAASGPAPVSLTATSASGQQVTVPGGGKPSLLFFFSASCGTCGPAAHAVAQAQQANPQGANYVAVDMDPAETPATIAAFLRTNQASELAVTSDRGGALTSTYGITQLSTAVTLNPSGQVVTRAVEPQTAQIQAGLAQARTP